MGFAAAFVPAGFVAARAGFAGFVVAFAVVFAGVVVAFAGVVDVFAGVFATAFAEAVADGFRSARPTTTSLPAPP